MCFLHLAPSGPPQSLTVTSTTVTLFSITIQWGEVECLEQNSEITGYSVRYETVRYYYYYYGMTTNVTGASNRMFTIQFLEELVLLENGSFLMEALFTALAMASTEVEVPV